MKNLLIFIFCGVALLSNGQETLVHILTTNLPSQQAASPAVESLPAGSPDGFAINTANLLTSPQVFISSTNDLSFQQGLLAYYPYESNTNDASGNNAHAAFNGSAEYLSGARGNAVRLQGNGNTGLNGDYVTLPALSLSSQTAITLNTWVNEESMSNPAGEYYIFFGHDNNGVLGIGHFNVGNTMEGFSFRTNAGGGTIDIVGQSTHQNNWAMFTLTYQGGTIKAYINGQLVGTKSAATLNISGSNAAQGAHWWASTSSRFTGRIDETRIYNRVLPPAEIDKLFGVNSTDTICPGLSFSLTANASLPSTYAWSSGQNTSTITVAPTQTTTYTVTITASNGTGTATAQRRIVVLPKPTLAIATISTCSGQANGSATVSATGGATPYTYKWNNNQTTATVINVAAGTYTVTVTGNNGCSATATATVGSIPAGIDCALVARFKFDNSTNDISGNNNNGTTPNGISYVDDKFGNCKSAARFNGTNTYVTIPASNSLNSPTGSITLMGWAKSQSPNIQSILCKSFSGTSTLHYRLGVNGAGADKIFFGYRMEGQSWSTTLSVQLANLNLADWNHYAVTWDGTTVRFFWNGVEKGSGVALTGIIQPNDATTPLELGRDIHGGTDYFNGDLDELRVYYRALSVSEILQLYSATGNTPIIATIPALPTPSCPGQSNGAATVSASGGTTPYTYHWSNNQTTATATNLAAGIYTVTVTGNNSCTATATATVGVKPATTALFSASIAGAAVSFVNTSTNATSYSWDFGDGNNSTQINPLHAYAKPGLYQVCLVATGLCGNVTVCQSVVIYPPGWDPIVCSTGIVHIIAVWDTVIANIDVQPLASGDFVGFFHTDLTGANVCNNAGVWTGSTLVLPVCGDNPATPDVKEGFSIGENFLVRVWKDTTEYNVVACFVPKDSYGSNDPNATGSFAPFGQSYIECLKTPPPPGTALGCASPIPIACGETKTGNTANGISAAISYNCFFNLVDGPEVVYEFTNPITQNVLITLTGLQEDLEVLLLDACDRNSCIRFSDRTGAIPEALLANNLPAGTYFIIVDGYLGSNSPYTLNVSCGSNTTTNGTLDCTSAIAAQCGQTIAGNTNNGADQIVQYGCSATYNSGKEKMYALTLTENKVVSARLFGLSADLNLIVLNACDPAACFTSSSRSGTEDDAVLFYATAGKTYYFVVDGYFDAEGPYSLTFSCWDPCTNCPNPYDLNGPTGSSSGGTPCELAQVLQCGIPVSGNNNNGHAYANSYSCPNSYTTGKEVIYKFTIEETQDVTLILSGLSANLDLYLLDDCSVFNCHAASHKTGNSDEGMVLQALAAGTYYVVVDGYNGALSGYSLVVNCANSTLNCQSIDLVAGTNFISSNILPIDPAIDAMFPPSAQSKIISIESQGNLSYSPNAQTDPNAFGNWDFRKAYRIKALEPVSVEVCGEKADPDTPIPFVAKTPQGQAVNNWSAYLKDDPAQVGDKFTPALTPKIFRVWNMPTAPTGTLSPQAWLVTVQGGTNFQLKSGRGYILNATMDGEYAFGFWHDDLSDRNDHLSQSLVVENGCAYFQTPFYNSMKAATVILPKSVLAQTLAPGDEIGIFRQDGSLFASGLYNGFALSLIVSGDEPATPDFSEGFSEGETMFFRRWNAAERKVYDLKATFQSAAGDFNNEAVYVVNGLEVLNLSAVQTPKTALEWMVYPNPARETIWFDLLLPQASTVHLELFSADGRQLRDIADREMPAGRAVFQTETDNLAFGYYLVKMTTEQGVSFKKIIISKK